MRRLLSRPVLAAALLVCALGALLAAARAASADPAGSAEPARSATPATLDVAFHYGAAPPLQTLRLYDVVVVDPDQPVDPDAHRRRSAGASELYAYASIGEVDAARPWAARVPAGVIAGRNAAWGTGIVDPADPRWTTFFVDEVIAPAWARGFRGFFLDTLDAYQALDGDAARQAERRDGLVRTVEAIRARFPQAQLIANRGFELLPRIAPMLRAIAAESLVGRWDPVAQRYARVPQADRDWLLARLQEARDRHGLQPIAIEYADPMDREAARAIAREVLTLGITPWVADGAHRTLGLGALDPAARRVLVLHDGASDRDPQFAPAHRLLAMPLQYLGHPVDLVDVRSDPLPEGALADRYLAVVGWFGSDGGGERRALLAFLHAALDQKLKLVFFNSMGTTPDARLLQRLGLSTFDARLAAPLTIRRRDPLIGFEQDPQPNRGEAYPLVLRDAAQSLLRIADGRGRIYDGAGLTPWGGFVMAPFTVVQLPGTATERWVVQPIDFLRRALDAGDLPVPDPTTATGRRVLTVHIDGDGFPSRAEIPGTPFASRVLLDEFVSRYKVPHTVSVIEGEIAPHGLHPKSSRELEDIARRLFALPHVEIASHSLSHPFDWRAVMAGDKDRAHALPVPNYRFDLDREIAGSAAYIDGRLAPPGKKTSLFLWTGDCIPPAAALDAVQRAGLLNLNGGDTAITRRDPSLTRVSPMSVRREGRLQVFAPNQNESAYTDNWRSGFYRIERMIETYELTERPWRIKPVALYYHAYAASKPASIQALHRIYRWALAQPVHPLPASNWVRSVLDFEDIAMARDLRRPGAWKVAGDGALRTLRWPAALAERLDWRSAQGLAGSVAGTDGHYLHLAAATARFEPVVQGAALADLPRVVEANGRIDALIREGRSMNFRFSSHVAGELTLSHHDDCRLTLDGRPLSGRPLKAREGANPESAGDGFLLYRFPATTFPTDVLVSVHCG